MLKEKYNPTRTTSLLRKIFVIRQITPSLAALRTSKGLERMKNNQIPNRIREISLKLFAEKILFMFPARIRINRKDTKPKPIIKINTLVISVIFFLEFFSGKRNRGIEKKNEHATDSNKENE